SGALRLDGGAGRMSRGMKGARGPRNSVQDRPGRLRLLMRRQRRLLRPAAWVAGAALFLLLVVALLRSGAPGGAFDRLHQALAAEAARAGMEVRRIEIEGRANTPEQVLEAALDLHRGAPILGVPIDRVAARVERLSWVQHATVERRLPDTIVVRLIERRPFAIWQDHGRMSLIDRAGGMVTDRNVADFRTLPLVVGPGAAEAASRLIDALNAAPSLSGRVAAAVRVGDRRWNLMLRSGITVKLPAGHAPEAIARLVTLQARYDLLGRQLRTIDLRLPNMLILRPIAAAPAAKLPTGKPVGSKPT
ncbi:MAG: cell division protein FtsQ/DivIB, partial [Rhodospirillales bacterium]|nr:cell division protein FtsQ/DivIB [Rhodospirillales bacterium]